jgi:hypothetical protein
MAYILKNKNLEIEIDQPLENYNFSRFDWTGKIVAVKFQNILLTSPETNKPLDENKIGKGFYNEFGIETALGFEEAAIGGWFHKIGVGLLKKEDPQYQFGKSYKVKPGIFKVTSKSNSLSISCESQTVNGYAYLLEKVIQLNDSGFQVNYHLKNTGDKDILTDEYGHNFIAINKDLIGKSYRLKFPFQLKPALFNETVNPEQKIILRENEITFTNTLEKEFFFSNLSGNESVDASWELLNLLHNIGIREKTSFKSSKINLWGGKHVISPELFFHIFLEPNQSKRWSRTYSIYKLS